MGLPIPDPEPVSPRQHWIVGYVTALRPAPVFCEWLFLHAGERTYRLELPQGAASLAAWVTNWSLPTSPIGPEHLLEVRGIVTGGTEAPVLRADCAEYLGERAPRAKS